MTGWCEVGQNDLIVSSRTSPEIPALKKNFYFPLDRYFVSSFASTPTIFDWDWDSFAYNVHRELVFEYKASDCHVFLNAT